MGSHVSKIDHTTTEDQETLVPHSKTKGAATPASDKIRTPMQDIRVGYTSGMLRI